MRSPREQGIARFRRAAGFSLVEMMIAMVLGLIVVARCCWPTASPTSCSRAPTSSSRTCASLPIASAGRCAWPTSGAATAGE
ncbi:MAG: prepilin-type N-terminal cleavage/methylation domain-containing protein [Frateuria sp.]|nr:prepilin-type N-terminal cleavage/methylation domain-containing protein [Frateuria sp.]